MQDDLKNCHTQFVFDFEVHTDYYETARKLVNIGYRKQSEGEWIDLFNGDFENPIYVCSVCGKRTLLKPHINELGTMEMVQALSPYCPNCGAKMKGERYEDQT